MRSVILKNGICYGGSGEKRRFLPLPEKETLEVDIRTISRYIEQNNDELVSNGYEVLKGKRLKSFVETAKLSGKDINVPTKTTVLS